MLTLRKRHCKLWSIFLLAVVLLTSIPVVPVSASSGSPFPFDYPSSDTFYPVDFVIKLANAGSADYLRVRTDNGQKIAYWEFLETYTIAVTPDPFSKYTFYDDLGNVVDNPFIGGTDDNLLLVRDDYTDSTGGSYGIVVASNATLYTYEYGVNIAESDSQVYFYQNYISMAATPTPTPVPQPTIRGWFDYPELPSNFSKNTMCILRTHSDGINDGQLIGIAFYGGDSVLNYPNFYKDRSPYNFRSQASINYAITINTWISYRWFFSVFTVNYDESTDSYSVGYNLKELTEAPIDDTWFTSNKLDWRGETLCSWSLIPDNDLVVTGEQAGIYANSPQSWFEILFTNHNYTPGTSDNPNVSPTSTPRPSPTLVPQPSINPEPTVEPPDSGDDNNWTGLFGWFKKLINSILSIPAKIVNGILNALKYIFIPDMNKVKQVYSDLNDKVGIKKPAKFDFDPAALTRPHNVYFYFHSIPINGQESETTKVTIIDFKQVDDWLDTSAGHMIIKICKACFSLLLWAYMIYVFTKHIGAINYTDAQRLEGVYKRSNSFEGDETDV